MDPGVRPARAEHQRQGDELLERDLLRAPRLPRVLFELVCVVNDLPGWVRLRGRPALSGPRLPALAVGGEMLDWSFTSTRSGWRRWAAWSMRARYSPRSRR